MEGKEVRFGIGLSALFTVITTAFRQWVLLITCTTA
ncbi:potassium-transporting ATPase subunit KdpA [Staphylococcus aureus]